MPDTVTRTRVVHVNDNVPGAVYIGRANRRRGLKASRWANAFTVQQHGRRGAIELYEYYLREELVSSARQNVCDDLYDLIGKPLACWCRHDGEERTEDNACHGDVLVTIIRELWPEKMP